MDVAVLTVHIIAGTTGLALGPLLLIPRWYRRLGGAYQIAIVALTVTALVLVALDPSRLWWLAPIAVVTQVAAATGWFLTRRDGRSPMATRLLGGSYVSLVTALLVVSWGGPLAWVLPTVIGVVLVETAAARTPRANVRGEPR